ncbi:MAG: hypothetical protein ABIJ21_02145 [Nanoarchaeota archaeon]
MTKISYILLILLAIPIIHAACDYTDQEEYKEEGTGLCLPDTQSSQGIGLIISDITEGERPSFTAYNPNNFPVKAYFNYTISGFLNEEKFSSKPIGSKDTEKIDRLCFTQDTYGNCSITRIDYFLTEPRQLEPCFVNFTKTRDICNKPCRQDIDCISTVCNIAGFCGKEKIVTCQDGTINCNDYACLKPGSKKGGEAYSCEWECSSGIGVENTCKEKDGANCQQNIDCESGVCNVLNQCGEKLNCPENTTNCENKGCFTPAIKKNGEAVSCDWECKSGTGKDDVCQRSNREKSVFYSIIILLFGVGVFLSWKTCDNIKRKKAQEIARKIIEDALKEGEDKGRKIIEDATNKAKDDLKTILIKYNETSNAIDTMEEEKNNLQKQLTTLEKEKNKTENIKKRITKIKTEIHKLNGDLNKEFLEQLETTYGRARFEINNNGYPVFSDTKKPIHREIYKNQYYVRYKNKFDTFNEVHHIDGNKLNSLNFWNLIDVPHSQHKKIAHLSFNRGDWKGGLKELMHALNWTESNLPEHIKEHLKTRKSPSVTIPNSWH